jgi:hypothetical protein
MSDDPIAIVSKFVADYEDAPSWGGPTMYPAVPIGAISAVLGMAKNAPKPLPPDPIKALMTALEQAYLTDVKNRRPASHCGWRTAKEVAELAGMPTKQSFARRVLYRAKEQGLVNYQWDDHYGAASLYQFKKGR